MKHRDFPLGPVGYRIHRELGAGAFKEAFEAERVDTGERLAIKRYKGDKGGWVDPRDLTVNFLDLKYHHRNLLPAHRIAGGWIAEPLLEEVLSNRLTARNRYSLNALAEVFTGLLHGLEFLHASGLIHGDIKPHNLGVQSGVPVLCDFGTASIYAAVNRASRPYPGTLRTRPPELNQANASPTPESDVWMIAATLLALRTGSYPFLEEKDLSENRERAETVTRERIQLGESALHAKVIATVEENWLGLLLCHGLRFDAARRPDAGEFRAALATRSSAPRRLIDPLPEVLESTADIRHQHQLQEVNTALDSLFTKAFHSDHLLQSHIIDELTQASDYTAYALYKLLNRALHKELLSPAHLERLRKAAEANTYASVYAAILVHFASRSTASEAAAVAAFERTPQFGLPYNLYGKIVFERPTTSEFLGSIRRGLDALEATGLFGT